METPEVRTKHGPPPTQRIGRAQSLGRAAHQNPSQSRTWALAGGHAAQTRLVSPSPECAGLARITSALFSRPSAKIVDRVLRDCVEFARTVIHLERTAIFLLTPDGSSMCGTWGTDFGGGTTDEHELLFDVNDRVRESFALFAEGHAWSVYEDSPFTIHEGDRAKSLGRGWMACTPIQGRGSPIGVLFNDTAITRAPYDEIKQARAALMCSLLARGLEPCRDCLFDHRPTDRKLQNWLVQKAIQALLRDPSLSFRELAHRLRVTKGHLTRTFKHHMDLSIVDYRNKLRLAQFMRRVENKGVLRAALGAGFGSYAQFHRVFRTHFGMPPREYLFDHKEEQA